MNKREAILCISSLATEIQKIMSEHHIPHVDIYGDSVFGSDKKSVKILLSHSDVEKFTQFMEGFTPVVNDGEFINSTIGDKVLVRIYIGE
jgi:hypothetical protein